MLIKIQYLPQRALKTCDLALHLSRLIDKMVVSRTQSLLVFRTHLNQILQTDQRAEITPK